MMFFSGVLEMPAVMKSSMPKGGVVRPIIMLMTMTTPKWTRSMPSALISGSTIGMKTSVIAIVSMNMPRARNTKFMISSITYLLSVMPRSRLATRAGIFSIVTM